MSAPSQSRSLAPDWLTEPDDANALAPLVWPESATRDDHGVLTLGGIADLVVRDYTVCLAQYIPAGVTLTDVTVDGSTLVAEAAVDGAIVTDTSLQAHGTCG